MDSGVRGGFAGARRVQPWSRSAHAALTLTGTCITLLWFSLLAHHGVMSAEELRFAGISQQMLTSGDYVVPRFAGVSYLDQAPLAFWATAASYRLFGVTEFATRLPVGVAGYASLLLVLLLARYLWDLWASVKAGLLLIASSLFLWFSYQSGAASLLSFWLLATLASFAVAQSQRRAGEGWRAWMLIAWASMALAVLCDGLVGAVVPMTTFAVYVIWQRDFEALQRLNFRLGLTLFLALETPWFALAALRDESFFGHFFVHRHVDRFIVPGNGHAWWFFLPLVALCAVGWLPQVGRAAYSALRAPIHDDEFDARRLLLVWCLVIFAYCMVSGVKFAADILPLAPGLALLCADPRENAARWPLTAAALLAIGSGIGTLVFLSGAGLGEDQRWLSIIAAVGPILKWVVVTLMTVGLVALAWLNARRPKRALATLCLGWFVSIALAICCAGEVVGLLP